MGSPLRPTLVNVFLCYHEKNWLQNCPSEFKPVIYRGYVDDKFLLFCSKHHIEKFRNYLNRQHKKIKKNLKKTLYGFLTLKQVGIITNSRLQFTKNRPLAEFLQTLEASSWSCFTLLHKAFKLCSNFEPFHQEIDRLKTIFENNGYPKTFVDICIKKCLDKIPIKMRRSTESFKKELICVLSFIVNKSLQLRTRLVNSIENNIKFCQLPFRKRSAMALFTDTRVVTAGLLSAIFLLELQSILVYIFSLESVLKVSNNQQYLITYLNVTVQ